LTGYCLAISIYLMFTKKFTLFMAFAMLMAYNLAAHISIVCFGSAWKYQANGSIQATAWQATAFDNGSWKSGAAILGYGPIDCNNSKVLRFGLDPNNTWVTAFFRKTISLRSAYPALMAKNKKNGAPVHSWSAGEVPGNAGAITGACRDMGEDHITIKVGTALLKRIRYA
jgi:hypothetical protein